MKVNLKQVLPDVMEGVMMGDPLDKFIILSLNSVEQGSTIEHIMDKYNLIQKIKNAPAEGADYTNVEQKMIEDYLLKTYPIPSIIIGVMELFDNAKNEAATPTEPSVPQE